MKEGDIVLFAFPQADGKAKNRPAVILREMPPFGDLLVCGISRQLHQEVRGFDDIIRSTDADFKTSGLADDSLVRLGFLTSLPKTKVVGVIGTVAPQRHMRLLRRLADYLTKS
jgi:mRNA interferase MazF